MRHRHISLYVEWQNEEDAEAVRDLLRGLGVQVIGVDRDTDLLRRPWPLPRRENAVFRLKADRAAPVEELLSAVAMLPAVDSVSEI